MPLVLLTSMGVRSDHPDFASASFAGCLTKPIKPAQLHETLLRVMSGAKPAAPKAAVPSAKLDPTLASRLPLRVLLCDDNIINQKVALRLLQQMGYRADLAANGLEALAALDRQPYDLIFMDVMMPEMGGLEATRLIRERQKQPSQFPNYKSSIIIVAMTASAMQGDREKCLAAGMDDYVAKPVRLEDVRAIVERWGAVAGQAEPAATTATGTQASTAANAPAQASPAAAPPEDAPVDMARLLDFTDGDPENLRELVTLYLDQTGEQLEQLEAAVQAGAAQEVRRLAHSCAGASATCGMRRLVPLLRELERQGFEGQPHQRHPAFPAGRRGIRTDSPFPGGVPGRALQPRRQDLTMKKILIVEDDQIVANIYRNKFSVEGYQVEIALDGLAGLEMVRTFRPDAVILDLMLPKMTGVEVMKKIRAEPDFQRLPVIVFSNTYLTNMVQEAWKAGATKCLSKANCTPKQVIEVVRSALSHNGAPVSPPSPLVQAPEPARKPPAPNQSAPASGRATASDPDAEFQADLRNSFIEGLPATLAALRTLLQGLIK